MDTFGRSTGGWWLTIPVNAATTLRLHMAVEPKKRLAYMCVASGVRWVLGLTHASKMLSDGYRINLFMLCHHVLRELVLHVPT